MKKYLLIAAIAVVAVLGQTHKATAQSNSTITTLNPWRIVSGILQPRTATNTQVTNLTVTGTCTGCGGVASGTSITLNGQTGLIQTFATNTTATGLNFNVTSATNIHTFALSLQSGYGIPLTASTTQWSGLYNNVLSRLAVATGTAGTIFNVSTTTNSVTINIPIASSSNTGQLSAANWTTFNAKLGSISALTGPAVHVATSSDTNIVISISTTTANTLTFIPSFTGTLAAARLNSNVVQAFTNDTNVTASITAQNATLGWTGVLSVARGGTGTTTAPAFGQFLMGNGLGGYSLVATSSLGIIGGGGGITSVSALTGPAIHVATTSDTNITLSISTTTANTLSYIPGWTGVLSIARGGTATSTAPADNALLIGNGVGYIHSAVPSCSDPTNSKLLFNNVTRVFTCGTDQSGGGGSLSGGTPGFVTTWTGTSTVSSGTLRDNGTVSGVNATSSTVSFNVQGSGALNPFQITSSTGATILLAGANGSINIGTSTPFTNALNASTLIYAVTSSTNHTQINIQNLSGSATSSAGFVATANLGNDSRYFAEFGINNSNYLQPGFSGQSPFDAYLTSSDAGVNISTATTSAAGVIKFLTGGNNRSNERMRITVAGNVGIGTITPTATLFVQGTSSAPAVSPFVVASSTGTQLVTVTNRGNVGIGSTTPNANLVVQGLAASNTIAPLFTVSSSTGLQLLTVTSAGNIGIGTSTPQDFIEIVGAAAGSGITLGNNKAISFRSTAGIVVNMLRYNASNQLLLGNGNSVVILGSSGSSFSIGTGVAPVTALDVRGSGTTNIADFASSSGVSVLQVTSNAQILACTTCRLTIPQGTAPTMTAAGDISHDTTNDQLLYGATPNVLTATTSKAVYIEFPTATEDLILYTADVPVTITKVSCVIRSQVSNTPSWTFSMPHSTSVAGVPTSNTFSAGQTCTSTTTPQTYNTFSDITLAAGEVLRATSSAVSNASSTFIQFEIKFDRQ
jgi:hypothetical protein